MEREEKEVLVSEIERLKKEKGDLELEIKGYVEHKDKLIKKYFEIKSSLKIDSFDTCLYFEFV